MLSLVDWINREQRKRTMCGTAKWNQWQESKADEWQWKWRGGIPIKSESDRLLVKHRAIRSAR